MLTKEIFESAVARLAVNFKRTLPAYTTTIIGQFISVWQQTVWLVSGESKVNSHTKFSQNDRNDVPCVLQAFSDITCPCYELRVKSLKRPVHSWKRRHLSRVFNSFYASWDLSTFRGLNNYTIFHFCLNNKKM